MTLDEIRKKDPKVAQAYVYAVERRLGSKKAAERLGIPLACLKGRLHRARALLGGLPLRRAGHVTPEEQARVEAKLTRFGRCACRLLKPCDCNADWKDPREAARPGEGATYPGSPL